MSKNLDYLITLLTKIAELCDDIDSKELIDSTIQEIKLNSGNHVIINDSKIYIAVRICEEVLKYKQKAKLIGKEPVIVSIKYTGNTNTNSVGAYKYSISKDMTFLKPVIIDITADVNISKLPYEFEFNSLSSTLYSIVRDDIKVKIDNISFINNKVLDEIVNNSYTIHKAIHSGNINISEDALIFMIDKLRVAAARELEGTISSNYFSFSTLIIEKSGIEKLVSLNNVLYYLINKLDIPNTEDEVNRVYLLIRDFSSDIDAFNIEVCNSRSLTWMDKSEKANNINNKLQRLSETLFKKYNDVNSKSLELENKVKEAYRKRNNK